MTAPTHRFLLTVTSNHDAAYLKDLLSFRLANHPDLPFTLDVAPDTQWAPRQPVGVAPMHPGIAEMFDRLIKAGSPVQYIVVLKDHALILDREGRILSLPDPYDMEKFDKDRELLQQMQAAGQYPYIAARPAPVLDRKQQDTMLGLHAINQDFNDSGLLELFKHDPDKLQAASRLQDALKDFLREVKS